MDEVVVEARDGFRVGVVLATSLVGFALLALPWDWLSSLLFLPAIAWFLLRGRSPGLRRVRIGPTRLSLERRDGDVWVHHRAHVGALGIHSGSAIPVRFLRSLSQQRLVVFDPAGRVVQVVRVPWFELKALETACHATGLPWVGSVPFDAVPVVAPEQMVVAPDGPALADPATAQARGLAVARNRRSIWTLLAYAVVVVAAVVVASWLAVRHDGFDTVMDRGSLPAGGAALLPLALVIGFELSQRGSRRRRLAIAAEVAERVPWRPVDVVIVRKGSPRAASSDGCVTSAVLLDPTSRVPVDALRIVDVDWRGVDPSFVDGQWASFLLCVDDQVEFGLLATPDRCAVAVLDRWWHQPVTGHRSVRASALVNTWSAQLSAAGWPSAPPA